MADSEEFLGGFSIRGIEEEIFENVLVIQKFNGKEEKIFVTVSIGQDIQVIRDGTEIAFEEIKKGDKAFILPNQMRAILSDAP